MAEKTVAVVGSMNCDIILKVKRLPEIGETMVAESAVMSAGGKGGPGSETGAENIYGRRGRTGSHGGFSHSGS